MIYRISEQTAAAEKSKMLRRTAFINATVVLFAMLVCGWALLREANAIVLSVWAIMGGVFICLTVWTSLRRINQLYKDMVFSFQITVDDQSIAKVQKNTPDVTLARSDIKRVEEHQGKGFRIGTDDHLRNIWVPCELDEYEQLKADMRALPGVAFTTSSKSWLQSYLAIAGFLLLFSLSVIAADKNIAAGASLLIGAAALWSFFKNFRNPNLTDRGRRQFLVIAFVGVCFLIRAYLQWRG